MFIAKAFNFLFWAGLACLAPYLTLYYQQQGLSGREIGLLTGIVPLISTFATTIWSMAADATGRHRLMFLLAIVGTWISVFMMARADSFRLLVPVVILYAFCFSPIVPLVDNAILDMLGPQSRSEYGRIRVWGSFGWGLAGALIGIVIAASGLQWTFIAFLAIYVPVFLLGTRLPMSALKNGRGFWKGLRHLLANRAWLLFVGVALVEGLTQGIYLNFIFLYLNEMGASAAIMGLTLTAATISEIPVFLYSRRLLGRWSAPFLLAVSMVFTVIRSFAYIGMTDPWQVLLISLLHGPTYALMWSAGVAYAADSAPPGLGATAQGVFGALSMGLGPAIGAFIGGMLMDGFGVVSVFYLAGFASLAATLIFMFVNRKSFRGQMQAV